MSRASPRAAALGADVRDATPDDAGDVLADRVIYFMRELDIPNGLAAVGYSEADVPTLVAGTPPQHRVTNSPATGR
ncbi:MAG: hypothetical protein R3C10_10090 [Pirellulales bacterium]